jgi:anti-sigma B factor antagonist
MAEHPPLERADDLAAQSLGALRIAVLPEPDRDRTLVQLGGELDLATAPKLQEQLGEIVDEGADGLIIDLRGLGFMDSTGLRVLLGFRARLGEAERELVLVVADGPVLRLLELTGLVARFTVVPEPPA